MVACTKEQQQSKNIKPGKAVPDPGNGPNCGNSPSNKAVQSVGDDLKKELDTVSDPGCSCSGRWGKWGDWKKGKRVVPVVEGGCKWNVTFTWEVRARTYTGVCVETGTAPRIALWEYDAETERDYSVKLTDALAKLPYDGGLTADSGLGEDIDFGDYVYVRVPRTDLKESR